MCGIAGFSGPPNSELLRRMCRALLHRGPDDEGFYESPEASLGMRRLAIVDPETGRQPVASEAGNVRVIQNGEIYNHRDLRKQLQEKGHVFSTHHSDTEVIVHLYEEHGENWPAFVNGMFGAAVWDRDRKRLLLFRDRVGKKPLYYARIRKDLAFASEIKALLLHPDVGKAPDFQALYDYFGLKNTSAPRTAFRDIRQLLPGQGLIWENGRVRTFFFWKPDFSPLPDPPGFEDASETLFSLLKDAVALRMDCDAPYGAYLSGGVDSTTVVSLMSRLKSEPVKTFCLAYPEDSRGQFAGKEEDRLWAGKMAGKLGTEHRVLSLSAADFQVELPEALGAFDEPFSGTISTFFLSRLIARHVKVAVSGDGADELFGSYLSHRLAMPAQRLLKLKKQGKNRLADFAPEERESLAPFDSEEGFGFLSRVADKEVFRLRDRLSVFCEEEKRGLFSREFFEEAGAPLQGNPWKGICAGLSDSDPVNRALEVDQRELLPNQVLPFVDRLSMAHSVEVRCPFLDTRVVEFVNRLPGSYKIRGGRNKALLKHAVRDLVPREILDRPKEGFVQPVYSWMRTSLKVFVRERLEGLPGQWFRKEAVRALAGAFEEGTPGIEAKVWNLACFGLWYEAFHG